MTFEQQGAIENSKMKMAFDCTNHHKLLLLLLLIIIIIIVMVVVMVPTIVQSSLHEKTKFRKLKHPFSNLHDSTANFEAMIFDMISFFLFSLLLFILWQEQTGHKNPNCKKPLLM